MSISGNEAEGEQSDERTVPQQGFLLALVRGSDKA